MKNLIALLCLAVTLLACKKTSKDKEPASLETILKINAGKVTITNGVWGTVSTLEGNCMPMVDAKNSTCKAYAIQREVRIYTYTTIKDAIAVKPPSGLFESFNTQLIKTVQADSEGFFETNLPDGKYTLVFVENGKLYAQNGDGQGGIAPVEVKQNKVNYNPILMRAVF